MIKTKRKKKEKVIKVKNKNLNLDKQIFDSKSCIPSHKSRYLTSEYNI